VATVFVVDDDASFRKAIGRLLKLLGYDVAGYGTAAEFLACPLDALQPSCILLDVQLPDLSGPDLQDHLQKLGSAIPIVFLTGHGDVPTSVRAIKAGADDFLIKPVTKERLDEAIRGAVERYQARQGERERVAAWRTKFASLTPREKEVFEGIVRGKLNKQIAHELGTTERTIKAHRQHVIEKMQVRSLAELAIVADRLGVLAKTQARGGEAGR
jgi:FixJ family two-component response regulator